MNIKRKVIMCRLLCYLLCIALLSLGLYCENSTDSSSNNNEQESVSLPENVIISIPDGI